MLILLYFIAGQSLMEHLKKNQFPILVLKDTMATQLHNSSPETHKNILQDTW